MPDVFNSLIFADHGGGKTTLLGSIMEDPEEFLPALLLDVDGGSNSIGSRIFRLETGEGRQLKPDTQGLFEGKYIDKGLDKIHCLRVKSWLQFEDVFSFLNDPDEKGNIYRTCMVDSGSTLNDLSLDEIVAKARASSPKRAKERDSPQLDEFGDNLTRMRRLVSTMKDWPIHVIWTALSDWNRSDVEGIWLQDPSFTGQLGKKLPALFENVLFLKIEYNPDGPKRYIQFQADDRVRAKARDEFGVLGFQTDKWSIPYILNKFREGQQQH